MGKNEKRCISHVNIMSTKRVEKFQEYMEYVELAYKIYGTGYHRRTLSMKKGIDNIPKYKEKNDMEYLYHGSSGYFDKLIPQQAYDTGYEEGCKKAVYATSNKNMALAFALGAVPNKNGEIERVMMPEFGDIMVFEKGTPNYGGKGYLYVLDKRSFSMQWDHSGSVSRISNL